MAALPVTAAVAIHAAVSGLWPGAEPDAAALRRAYSAPADRWPAPWLLEGAEFAELAPLTLPARPEPGSREAAVARLGEALFNDPALSASGQIACQSCHNRALGWGDGLPRAIGHDRTEGARNTPALFSAGFRKSLFWDGRATTLEAQTRGPLTDPAEMANHDLQSVAGRLIRGGRYPVLFLAAFGSDRITPDTIAQALAAFQRGLEVPTKLDRFLSGNSAALTDAELRGLHLFRTKAMCANCHNGPLLTDERFHNLGLSFLGRRFQDLGRHAVTGEPYDAGRFRTPSLRHVSRTAPYMHNGLFPHLRGLVNFYAGGGGQTVSDDQAANPLYPHARTVSPLLQALDLTRDEREDLVAFLNAL